MEQLKFVYISPEMEIADKVIGVFHPGYTYDNYHTHILNGIKRIARFYDASLILSISNHMLTQNINAVLERSNLVGVILLTPADITRILDYIELLKIPYVSVDYMLEQPIHATTPLIEVDNYLGIHLAFEHLRDLGHDRIAFLGAQAFAQSGAERVRAFHDGIDHYQLAVPPSWFAKGFWHVRSGYECAQAMFAQSPHPTAIISINDEMAVGAIQYCMEHGIRIPEDVSITGFDDLPIAQTHRPALTTIHQPIQLMGETAVHLLWQVLGHATPTVPQFAHHIKLAPHLVVRETTAIAKNKLG